MSTRTNTRYTGTLQIIAMPEAEIIASGRILTPDECWVPTDGADMGKHAGGNGVDTYQNLVFWEDAGGGGGGTVDTIGFTSQNGVNGAVDSSDPANPAILPSGVNALLRRMSQANAFTQGQALKVEAGGGGVAALAQGDDAGNASFVGFYYNAAAGVTGYDLLMPGSFATIFTGLTAGAYHYLDPVTPGALTTTPNAFGPVLKATSTTAGYVLSNSAISTAVNKNYLNGVAQSGTYTFTGTSDASGRLTVNLTTATPAMATAFLMDARGGNAVTTPIVAHVNDPTPGSFTLEFLNVSSATPYEGDVQFTVGGTLA